MGKTRPTERACYASARRKPGWFLLTAFLVITSYLLLVSAASAQTDPTPLLQQLTDAYNRHDAAGVAALFAADATYQGGSCQTLPNQTCVGPAAIQQAFVRTFAAQPATLGLNVGTPQVSGDTITSRVEIRSSVVRKAGVGRYVYIRIWQIRNGKIAAAQVRFDTSDSQTAQYVAVTQAPSAAALPRAGEPTAPMSAGLGIGMLLLSIGLTVRRAYFTYL